MDPDVQQDLLEFFAEYVSEHKKQFMQRVLETRTRMLTFVLEDMFKSHNASAVLRTCESFGIQDLHIVENENTYSYNPYVSRGATNWLTVHHYQEPDRSNTWDCLHALKEKGYRIAATRPREDDTPIDEYDILQPTALVFGTEFSGISREAEQLADDFVYVPMVGFTESLNISVTAGICAYVLMNKIHSSDLNWKLAENEKLDILLEWYRRSVKRSAIMEKRFLSERT